MTEPLQSYLPAGYRLTLRWLGLLTLLAVELAWLSVRFDMAPLADHTGHWSRPLLAHAGEFLKVGFTVAGLILMVILLGRDHRAALVWRREAGGRWWGWLLLHGLAFTAFAWQTQLTTAVPATGPMLSGGQLALWTALGAVTLGLWLLALFSPRTWWLILAREQLRIALALIMGLAIWAGAVLAQAAWAHLARGTLWVSGQLLQLFYEGVVHDYQRDRLGTADFMVGIAPSCSGYEGIALMLAFTGFYLWLFRHQLRFPQALWLLPIGVAAIWLSNGLRIALLIVIGDAWSPEIAVNGFHSQAGWIFFTLVALGLVGLTHRVRLFSTPVADSGPTGPGRLAAALLLPLLVALFTAMVSRAFSGDFDYLYPGRMLLVGLVLWSFRPLYRTLGWGVTWQAVAVGAVVFLLWLLLREPAGDGSALPAALEEMAPALALLWLAGRLLGSVVIVPLVEELAFRGYLLRKLVARRFETVSLQRFTWPSFLLSSLLFGLLHGSWLAGTLAGMGYALALYRRGRLGDAVVAHMTSNALIAVWVLVRGDWSLWSA